MPDIFSSQILSLWILSLTEKVFYNGGDILPSQLILEETLWEKEEKNTIIEN